MRTNKLGKFTVRLNVPTVMWALVQVDAKDADEAADMALAQAAEGVNAQRGPA